MGKLYDKTVKKLIKEKSAVRHADGNGLYLMTPARGETYWMLRYTTPTTKLRREYTIGQVSDCSDICPGRSGQAATGHQARWC